MNWVKENTIILARVGSHSYGTNIETSDEDFKAVVIPPLEYFMGLEVFNEEQKTNSKDFRYIGEEIDFNAVHVSKFVKSAMQGVPNNIEVLFSSKENLLKVTPEGQELLDNRELFLSQRVHYKMQGYARSQYKKLITKQMNRTGRQNLVQEYGYDTKFAMHGVRLLLSAIQILKEGTFCTLHPQRELLIDIRKGVYTLEEVQEMFKELTLELDKAKEFTSLPTDPDYNKINELLMSINMKHLGLKGKVI